MTLDTNEFLFFIKDMFHRKLLTASEDIVVKRESGLYGLIPGSSLENPQKTSLIEIEANPPSRAHQFFHLLLKKRPEVQMAMFSKGPYTLGFSRTGKHLKPLLDDLAQIGGTRIPAFTENQFLKKPGSRNMVFIKGMGCLCLSQDIYELQAMALVAEKACLAEIGSYFLGKGHTIAFHEALLMNWLYKAKYSKMKK